MALSMVTDDAFASLQPPLAYDGMYNGRVQNWGKVGNRGWDSRPPGLGFVVPDIVGPLGGARRLGDATTFGPAVLAVGVLGFGVALAGPAIGAYKGAKKSPGWAAGGALIGIVAAGLTNAVLAAIVGAAVVQK